MKIKKINHVGIATNSIEQALKPYKEILGLKVAEIKDIPILMQRSAFVTIGDCALEIMDPTGPEGPIGKFVAEHGEGLHHISLEVEDIDALSEELKKNNMSLMLPEAVDFEGAKINFVHPESMNGVLLELVQSD